MLQSGQTTGPVRNIKYKRYNHICYQLNWEGKQVHILYILLYTYYYIYIINYINYI